MRPSKGPRDRAIRRRSSIRALCGRTSTVDFSSPARGSRSAAVRPATSEWVIALRRSLHWSAGCGTNRADREGFLKTWRCRRAVRGTCPADLRVASGSQSVKGRLQCVLPRTKAGPGAQSAELPRITGSLYSFHRSHVYRGMQIRLRPLPEGGRVCARD